MHRSIGPCGLGGILEQQSQSFQIDLFKAGDRQVGARLLLELLERKPICKKHFFGHRNTIGNIFYGSNGYLATGDEDASSYETWLGRDDKSGPHGHGGGDHFRNFIDCIRSRKKEDLNAPIEEGHISCALVHLANASYRLGRTLRFDPETERVIGDDEANSLLRDGDRMYRAPFAVPEEV